MSCGLGWMMAAIGVPQALETGGGAAPTQPDSAIRLATKIVLEIITHLRRRFPRDLAGLLLALGGGRDRGRVVGRLLLLHSLPAVLRRLQHGLAELREAKQLAHQAQDGEDAGDHGCLFGVA